MRAPPPLHLIDADFEAYLPARATSNAHTRPRLELKQRMLAWARTVVERLAELGIAVEVTGSDEHPSVRNHRRVDCQRVFFWRDEAARAELDRLLDRKRSLATKLDDPAPHKGHAYLALRLDSTKVDVSIELHAEAWVDLKNLRARLADAARALELTSALEFLPEQFSVGVGASAKTQAQRATTDEMRALLDAVERGEGPLWLGWSVPRDVAVAHSELLDEQLEDAIVALGPIYKLVAWAPDNDLLVLHREWAQAKEEQHRAHEEAERDKAAWQERRERERRGRARVPREEPSEPNAARHLEPPTPPPPRAEPGGGAKQLAVAALRAARKAPLKTGGRRAPHLAVTTDANAPIEKGTRVEVLAGPFAGKSGQVQELDGKGGARVMLGLLAMRFRVKDLVACVEGREARDRPVLSTSHRKHPARS